MLKTRDSSFATGHPFSLRRATELVEERHELVELLDEQVVDVARGQVEDVSERG
jgi:hypothetical protein